MLRYLTVRVKKFDLETNYFGKKEEIEKRRALKTNAKDKVEIKGKQSNCEIKYLPT